MSWSGATVYTVGHSTRTLDELVALLRAVNVSVLADIRTIPRSRHNLQLFEAFANVVPFQQLSLDAGVKIVGQLVERLGKYVEHNGHRYHAFPAARAVANARLEALREGGLSRGKAECLRRSRQSDRIRRVDRGCDLE